MQVLFMYDHLCVVRKEEMGTGVVYVRPPVYRSEGGCGCRCCVCNYVHLYEGRNGEYAHPPVCSPEGECGCTPVFIIMFTCVQAGREKWCRCCVCKNVHLCAGRKGEMVQVLCM